MQLFIRKTKHILYEHTLILTCIHVSYCIKMGCKSRSSSQHYFINIQEFISIAIVYIYIFLILHIFFIILLTHFSIQIKKRNFKSTQKKNIRKLPLYKERKCCSSIAMAPLVRYSQRNIMNLHVSSSSCSGGHTHIHITNCAIFFL